MRNSFFLLTIAFFSFACLGMTADPPSKMRWNVVEMGAVAGGEKDCTEAFQKSLDAAKTAGGGIVEVPAGRFRIQKSLVIPAGVTLQGTYRAAPANRPITKQQPKQEGSTLCAYSGRGLEKGPAFIQLAGSNAVVAGLVIEYPDWKQSLIPPAPYPPCIESTGTDNIAILDCCLLNPYVGIKLVRAGRHLVRNITGYPSKQGLYIDECYDIGRIENVHFWPFGVVYEKDEPYCKWVNTHGVAFEFARTDWQYVTNTFCFGYGVGYKFSESKNGSANGNFLGIGADSCQRAIFVEQAQAPGLLITNGEFVGRWGSTDSVCLEIAPKVASKVSLTNCSFWGPIDRCVWMRSNEGQFTANACNFLQWDVHQKSSPAIQLDAGKAIILGCTFNMKGLHVSANNNVKSAIITANQATDGLRVDKQSNKRVRITANEE